MASNGKMPERASETANKTEKTQKNSKGLFSGMSKTVVLTIIVLACGCVALFTAIAVYAHTSSIRASAEEYDHLRILAADSLELESYEFYASLSALELEMRQINPEYVGWLRIDGTNIDYPVVRGADNTKYLNTSFYGDENITGTIFMDYRNVGEPLQHIIMYGHNLQQGGMFTDLIKFTNRQFRDENNIITLIVNDNEVKFEIFSARMSDINDPAYDLNLNEPRYFARFANKIGAPLEATQILTLSTCTRGGSDDARVIVQASRIFD